MAVGTIVLTPKGQQKLQDAIQAVAEATQIALAREMQTLRERVAERTPSSEEEAEILSRGVIEGAVKGRSIADLQFRAGFVGTPEGGRFIRQGEQLSLREAILTDPILVTRQFDRMIAAIGNANRINLLTGFYWNTRKRGIQGPTLPFNQAYVQAMEDGGLVWTVVPRPGTKALEPEPGVLARRMRKTVGPYRMFKGALFAGQAGLSDRVRAGIRAAMRRVSAT